MNFRLEKAVLQVSRFRNGLNYTLVPSLCCLTFPGSSQYRMLQPKTSTSQYWT